MVLESESFEVYLGFLHGIRYGRKSLALDMVEEFRQPIVDRFVVRSFNKRILNEFDFDIDEGYVKLNDEGFTKFCREFERWMIGNTGSKKQSYRQLIRKQAIKLKKAIQNRQDYEPYRWGDTYDLCS